MRRIAKTGWILVLIALLLTNSAFARETVSTVKLNQVQQMNAELTMYVSMSDTSGYPCTGSYSADQFSISVDGTALDVDSIQPFDPQTQGIHYVFSVDVSRSLTDAMMQNVRQTLTEFVDALGPLDTVSLITFGEQVTERLVNSADREATKQVIASIQADEGMTALYKGVIDAVSLADMSGGRSAVVVITDGKNDPTEAMQSYTKDSIYDSVKNAQVPLYCVGLNDNDGVDTGSLIELAEVTGGDQFVIRADEISASLTRVRDIMRSALVLRATLINTQNKAGFDEVSTFKVGFQPVDGPFVTSNDLQQNINWKNVPVPEVSPTPEPIPQISLSLDDDEVRYVPGGMVTITGAIEVEQGVVDPEDLSISVNGESWWISTLMRNGNGYTFSAEGAIAGSTETLEIQAEIKEFGVASRIQRMDVIAPTQAPTATPSPILSVELDDSARSIMYQPGQAVNISGVVNVQGAINPNDLTLYVNGAFCEMTIMQINSAQYEFAATCMIQEGSSTELSVQVQLNGTEIYSRVQRLYLTTPSPTPSPELYFSLSDAGIEYTEGEPVTIRGNIEVLSGVVDPADLALYVNNVKWDMTLEALSDGTYGFTAENTLLDSDISQMDVKVRLQSNTKIVSNSEKLAVSTPVPTASPSPTPRAEVTPPPTAVPTEVPATPEPTGTPVPEEPKTFVEETMGKAQALLVSLQESGMFWYAAGGLALAVILIVLLIVLLARRKKNVIEPLSTTPSSFNRDDREGDSSQGRTRREDDADATVRNEANNGKDSAFVSDSGKANKTGTIHIDAAGGTMRINDETSGTQRIDEEPEASGTQRLEEEVRSIDVTLEESYNHRVREPRKLHIECNEELIFGRVDSADVVIDDGTVSSRHMMMTYDGEGVYIVDLGSTNGTKVNGEAVAPQEAKKIGDGDAILIGKTTLKVRLSESGMK